MTNPFGIDLNILPDHHPFPSQANQLVYDRTYSRTNPDGSRETWFDTVRRVARGNLAFVYGDNMDAWSEDVRQEHDRLVALMDDFSIIPAGRHLWATGVPGRQYISNCFVSGWTPKLSEHFSFTLLRLAEGGGVGANYSTKYTGRYPRVKRDLKVHIVCNPSHPDYEDLLANGLISTDYSHEWTGSFPVEDTREGWAEAMSDLLDTFVKEAPVKHQNRVYDVSRLRCKGSPLRTFGGVASGPEPFAQLLVRIGEIISARFERKLTSMDLMEIDHEIGACVVAGGNRRSARMSIVHWADPHIDEFLKCKSDPSKHWTTNISVEIDDEFIRYVNIDKISCSGAMPATTDLRRYAKAHSVYKKIVIGMLTNGEPGMWNSSLAQQGEPGEVVCTNPCGEINLQEWESCLPGDTMVLTDEGYKRIGDLAYTSPRVYSEYGTDDLTAPGGVFSAKVLPTGKKEAVKITTKSGRSITASLEHPFLVDKRWVNAGDLRVGDKLTANTIGVDGSDNRSNRHYLLGYMTGDGWIRPTTGTTSRTRRHPTMGVVVGRDEVNELKPFLDEEWTRLVVDSGRQTVPKTTTTKEGHLSYWSFSQNTADLLINNYGMAFDKSPHRRFAQNYWEWTPGHKADYLRGLFDADGCIIDEARLSIQLTTASPALAEDFVLALSEFGIVARASFSVVRDRPQGTVTVKGLNNATRFMEKIYGGTTNALNKKRSKLTSALSRRNEKMVRVRSTKTDDQIVSIVSAGVVPVFNMAVAGSHNFIANGMVTHNCILGHVNLDRFVDRSSEELEEAHRLMTRFLIRATYGTMNDERQKEIVSRNRRIGVGHLGVQSYIAKTNRSLSQVSDSPFFMLELQTLKHSCREEARAYAFQLRIPEPVKVTTVAPTGSIAKMPGVTEGIHPIYARYFNRRIRFSTLDPKEVAQLKSLELQGYHVEDCVYAANTKVVTIPTQERLVSEVEARGFDAEALVEAADEIKLSDMLRLQAIYQENYADNAVSFTVNIPAEEHQEKYLQENPFGTEIPKPSPERVRSVGETLRTFLSRLKGTTIMVDGTRSQAPYERLTKEEFDAIVGPKQQEDSGSDECSSGACPVR